MHIADIDDFYRMEENFQTFEEAVEKGKKLLNEVDYVRGLHGTSHRLKDIIEEEGLQPRANSEVKPNNQAAKSKEDCIYFTGREGLNNYAYSDNPGRRVHGGRIMTIEAFLDTDKLSPDEDSVFDSAVGSMISIGSVAHIGEVKPSKNDSSYVNFSLISENDADVAVPPLRVREMFDRIDKDKYELMDKFSDNFDTQLTSSEARKMGEAHSSYQRNPNTSLIYF